jgi:hypothetical protein
MCKEFAMQRKILATVLRNGFFLKAALCSVLLVAMLVGVTGCDDGESNRTGNSILGIVLEKADGSALGMLDQAIDDDLGTVTLAVPLNEDVTALIPRLQLSPGASVNPAPAEALNFTHAQTFKVEAENGSVRVWTVLVTELSPDNGLLSVTLYDSAGNVIWIEDASIDADKSQVTIKVAGGTPLTGITGDLVLSPGAKLVTEAPADGFDFTNPVTLTVEAQDGSRKTWTVKLEYGASSVLGLNVELAGTYDVKFGFSYPNHKESGGSPDYTTPYDYDIAYDEDGNLKPGNPIKLSYFITDNAIYDGTTRKTYYNTLVVSAAGFTGVEWRIDGRTAPVNNSTQYVSPPPPPPPYPPNNILTIRAQDWTLENTHTVVFVGTKDDVKYSGTFEFKVVEREPKEEAAE